MSNTDRDVAFVLGLLLLMTVFAGVLGYAIGSDRPHVAARCRASGSITVERAGDELVVRCLP